MPLPQTKLALADGHILFRKTLQDFLESQLNVSISLQSSDAVALLKSLKYTTIDILLVDTSLANLFECDFFCTMRHNFPDVKILCMSATKDVKLTSELLDQGIYGYITKLDEPQELLDAIHSVVQNKIYRNAIYTEALYVNKQDRIKDISTDSPALTEREKQILQFLWEEKSNKEIAEQVFLSIRSVEKIRLDMKQKLGLKSTVGLIKYGLYKKIIGLRPAI
jgi:DNA-binding NarL/FixJ family response regulator